MKRKLLCCVILALAAGSLPSFGRTQPAATENARDWLERMLRANQTLNYEGTFIYAQGPHLETMRIIHGGGPEGERQRLFSLSGPPRELVVANGGVICRSPGQQTAITRSDYRRSPFPLSIPRELGSLESHYALELLGEDRVAGLKAQVVAINPRDAWRFGYRLWLDQRNGMVLRAVLLDERGHPVEQFMFTDLQIKHRMDEAAFAPADGAAVQAQPNPDTKPPPRGEPVTQSAWRVQQLPDGFTEVSHQRFTEASGRHPTEHMVFADGLATISVFVERLEDAPPLLQGGSSLGSMNAFGTVVNGYQVLVVGEVPAATVQRLADSIQHVPKVSPP